MIHLFKYLMSDNNRFDSEQQQQQHRPSLRNDPSITSWTFKCPRDYAGQYFYIISGQALLGNTHLRELTLDQFEVENIDDAQFLAECIQQTNLESLTVKYDQRPEQRHLDSRLLFEMLKIRSSLTTLTIQGDCNDGGAGLRYFSSYDTVLLAKALHCNTNIKRLTLRHCDLINGGDVEVLFAQGLKYNYTLTHLELERCKIDDDGVQAMVEHWPRRSPIQHLSLWSNEIGFTGAQLLMNAVQDHVALKTLNLNWNSNIGPNGLRLIGEELINQQHHLTHVYLCGCLNAATTRDQKRAAIEAGQALLEAVKAKQTIQWLDVRCNGLPKDLENEIHFYARLNRTGRYLLSTNHKLEAAVWSFILAKCQHLDGQNVHLSTSLIFFYLREQPHLVPPSQN